MGICYSGRCHVTLPSGGCNVPPRLCAQVPATRRGRSTAQVRYVIGHVPAQEVQRGVAGVEDLDPIDETPPSSCRQLRLDDRISVMT